MAKSQARLFGVEERRFAETVAELCYTNPFSEQRLQLEKIALGSAYRRTGDAWSLGPGHRNTNLLPLVEKSRALLEKCRPKLAAQAQGRDVELYAAVLRYWLYYQYNDELLTLAERSFKPNFLRHQVRLFAPFSEAFAYYGRSAQVHSRLPERAHLFALLFQLRRAFQQIFSSIVGSSGPVRRLREALWQSVFTVDMRRYERTLYGRMHEFPTLVLGPSGTGKELVAQGIGMSRYLPFEDMSEQFAEEAASGFRALNISALAPGLLESELFGHARGAFTNAVKDRAGWLESCPLHGTVFLDEIGELESGTQVKLLRVLQTREFQRVGDTRSRSFAGKFVSATNKNLEAEVEAGRFRADFYYRLCADVVRTPSLAEQLADTPADLELLVSHLVSRLVDDAEAEAITDEVCTFVRGQLGSDYPWPGNMRELEQCVRNVLIRGSYQPRAAASTGGGHNAAALSRAFLEGKFNAEELLDVYVTLEYLRGGSYSEAGRKLGLDRRTVKARVDPTLLDRL